MITLTPIQQVKTMNKTGNIIANRKVYHSPTAKDKDWDICYKFNFPYNVLCNFTQTQFVHQGVKIQSMEGFLQSLKINDRKTQEKICTLPGFMAKKVGNYLKRSGKFDRVTLYWQGKQYNRDSKELQHVISEAYNSKHSQDRTFRTVLASSKGRKLTHSIGKNDPNETILTENEFVEHLEELRNKKPTLKERVRRFVHDVKELLYPEKTTKTIAEKLPEYKTSFVNDIYLCGEDPLKKSGKLRKLGVKNIIDINAAPQEAQKKKLLAEKHKLNYINIELDGSQKIVNRAETIKTITGLYNEGAPTYIIAQPKNRANVVLGINYLYNPKATLSDGVMFGTPSKTFIGRLAEMSESLSNEDKKSLGWGDNFNDKLVERRKTVLELNE